MKLLIDMNLSPRWVDFLVSEGIEAAHWSQVGKADAADVEIMGYAASHNCIVLTHDLDFSAILAVTQGRKPSVVQLRTDDVRTTAVGRQVVSSLRSLRSELEAGALLRLDLERARMRLLPLRTMQD